MTLLPDLWGNTQFSTQSKRHVQDLGGRALKGFCDFLCILQALRNWFLKKKKREVIIMIHCFLSLINASIVITSNQYS